MWLLTFATLVCFLNLTFCWSQFNEKLYVDYFVYRNVKFVCLLTCDNEISAVKFTKMASKKLIANSNVRIDGSLKNFDSIDKCMKQRFTSVGVLIHAQCPQFKEIVFYASENQYLDANHKWFIISSDREDLNNNILPNNTTDEVSTVNRLKYNDHGALYKDEFVDYDTNNLFLIMNHLNLSVDADMIISVKAGLSYDLFDVYNFGKVQGNALEVNYVGWWDYRGFNLSFDLNGYKYYQRWNFHRLKLRFTGVMTKNVSALQHVKPEIIFGEKRVPDCPDITRTSGILLRTIAELHNFSFVYTATKTWIDGFKNRSSSASATQLHFNDQDITPVLRMEFFERIFFLHPHVTDIETRFYYIIPSTGPGKLENEFLRPFTKSVWYCLVGVMVLCTIILFCASKFEIRERGFQYALFSVLSAFCQEFFESGGEQIRRTSSARELSLLVTGVSSLLIYNYYTSSVVSWLLNGPPPSINSLQELVDSPLDIILENTGYARSWLQVPNYTFNKRNEKVENAMRQKKIFNKKKDDPLLVDVEKGIEMMEAGGYALHAEVHSANMLISSSFTQEELCQLGSLSSMAKAHLYPAVPKTSPYKEFFIWSLARLKERGVLSCIQRRTKAFSLTCEGSSPRALALGGAAPAFLLLAFGYGLAIAIVLLERYTMKKKNALRQRKQQKN